MRGRLAGDEAMSGRYAADTSVSSEKSRAEIERTLQRYGATKFGYGWDEDMAMITFEVNMRQVRFILQMPDRNRREFTHTPGRMVKRTEAKAHEAWEQACRQRWRALALVVKAKLEAVAAGITEFEHEFLAHIVLPNGETVGTWVVPQIDRAYASGRMPEMLPQLTAGSGS